LLFTEAALNSATASLPASFTVLLLCRYSAMGEVGASDIRKSVHLCRINAATLPLFRYYPVHPFDNTERRNANQDCSCSITKENLLTSKELPVLVPTPAHLLSYPMHRSGSASALYNFEETHLINVSHRVKQRSYPNPEGLP
jgi:hypothetical protein